MTGDELQELDERVRRVGGLSGSPFMIRSSISPSHSPYLSSHTPFSRIVFPAPIVDHPHVTEFHEAVPEVGIDVHEADHPHVKDLHEVAQDVDKEPRQTKHLSREIGHQDAYEEEEEEDCGLVVHGSDQEDHGAAFHGKGN